MILIFVLYQNASTSRILEPSTQGLISSQLICLTQFNQILLLKKTKKSSYWQFLDKIMQKRPLCQGKGTPMSFTILCNLVSVEKAGYKASFSFQASVMLLTKQKLFMWRNFFICSRKYVWCKVHMTTEFRGQNF